MGSNLIFFHLEHFHSGKERIHYLVRCQPEVEWVSGSLPEGVVPSDEGLNQRTSDLAKGQFVIPDGDPEANIPKSQRHKRFKSIGEKLEQCILYNSTVDLSPSK